MIIRPATIMNANEQMSKAANLISEGTLTIIVQKNGNYMGIVSDKTLKTMQYLPDSKIGKYAWKAPVLGQCDSMEKQMEMFIAGYRELPIIEEGSIIGIVRNTDVLSELVENGKIPPMKVDEIMNVPIEKMDVKQSVAKALAVMRKEKKHHLLVTDAGKNVTVISSADMLPFIQRVKAKTPMGREKSRVRTMTLQSIVGSASKMVSIAPSASLREAAKMLIKNPVSALLVEGEGKVGMITVVDLIKTAMPKHEIVIDIVGLDKEEKENKQDIYNEILDFAASFEAIMPIEFMRLNVKKYSSSGKRHKYSMKLLVTGKTTFEVSSDGWKIFAALKDVLRQAERKIKEEKDRLKGKKNKNRKLKSVSIRIQEGDLYPGKPVE